jgi:hypothetical protein
MDLKLGWQPGRGSSSGKRAGDRSRHGAGGRAPGAREAQARHRRALLARVGPRVLRRRLAGQRLQDQHAEAIHIGLLRQPLVVLLLGRRVAPQPRDGVRRAEQEREAEVRHARRAVLVEQDVGGLDVVVGHAGRAVLPVDARKPARRAQQQPHPRRPVQRRLSRHLVTVEAVVEVAIGEVVVDEEHLLPGIVEGPERDEVRVAEAADEVHVAVELVACAGVGVAQPLHGDHAPFAQHRAVHGAQAAPADHLRGRTQQLLQLEPGPPPPLQVAPPCASGEGRARRRQTRPAGADLSRARWGRRGGGGWEEAAGWEVRARALGEAGEGGPGRAAVRRRGGASSRGGCSNRGGPQQGGGAQWTSSRGARLGELRRWMGKRGGAGGCWVEGPPREGGMSLPGRRRGRWLWGLGQPAAARNSNPNLVL